MTIGPALGMEIAEPDVLENKTLPDWLWERPGIGCADDPRPDLEKFEEVLQIEGPLRDAGKPVQYPSQQTPQLPERPRQKCQVANRQGAMYGPENDRYIGG